MKKQRAGGAGLSLMIACQACAFEVPTDPETSEQVDVETAEEPLAAQSWKLWMPAPGTAITSIPVCFESGTGLTTDDKNAVRTFATAGWDEPSRISFTGWGSCKYTCNDGSGTTFSTGSACAASCAGPCVSERGIHVRKDDRCHAEDIGSSINAEYGGIGLTTPPSRYCVVHEFGHALGFTHEQERSDNRDANGNLICAKDRTQSEPDLGITRYDDDSVMSYCGPNNGLLTPSDLEGLRGMYGYASMTIPYSHAFSSSKIALRAASKHFMGASPDDVLANQLHIKSHEKFQIVKNSGSTADTYLRYGDKVTFLTADGFALRARPSANNWVVDKSSTLGSCEQWTMVSVASPTSTGPVRVNDEVAFRSCYDRYLYRQSDNGNIRAHNAAIQGLEKWRILWLPYGSQVN